MIFFAFCRIKYALYSFFYCSLDYINRSFVLIFWRHYMEMLLSPTVAKRLAATPETPAVPNRAARSRK